MKKIKTTTVRCGLNGNADEELCTRIAYVSDDYEECYSEQNEVLDTEGRDYTKTLRDIASRIDDIGTELEEAWQELGDCVEQVESDATLGESDRKSLAAALRNASDELYRFSEERYDAFEAVEDTIDVLNRLPMAE